ncbi:alpha/beta fold hydrolase [Streptomyces sp. NPDC006610]|uniref:thioesterase II family protein n=1 Tax=Streptomyces sp. NPDC006610 TaxID=3154584 RepID=UPI0033B3CDC2
MAMITANWWSPDDVAAPDQPRVLLFPFAGGAAHSMREWIVELEPEWRPLVMQYPGRGSRSREPFAASVADLAAAAFADFLAMDDGRPPLVLGQSLGGYVAQAFTAALETAGITPRSLVVVSVRALGDAGGPPDAAAGRLGRTRWHQQSDDDLLARLHELGGADLEVFEHPALREALLPIVRADLAIGDDHIAHARPHRVRCPVLAVHGIGDRQVSAAQSAAWATWTTGAFQAVSLPGGHFLQQRGPVGLRGILAGLPARRSELNDD